ncbi:imidazolonepropionase [Naegleria gruberi]|uniref:Probable imidazolonepropionase n=1 Tax=Naegleria gruberi TaxID=5762 RepID=D2VQA5_NAEGR|nr:imidazolonepropionase [Naegleria gruberi]EFC41076.1 imidazolonepropionase [Naegleria gruberi]|eukprot:XP_002673820.1 imidazolonepropionase [Naegleria gruberi strain NEG-M]
MDIHKMGGGIGFTVRHTRESSEDELLDLLVKRCKTMLKNGSTLIEGKSGYGLETETEIKMLKVLHRANKKHIELGIPEIVSNYLGGHSVPKDSNLQAYTKQILEEQVPALAKMIEKDEIGPTLIDVFHEKGVFETEETRQVLKAGKEQLGLGINFHGDELNPMGSAELAHELDALAVSHCEHVSDKGIELMAEKNICASLLPTTAYILRIAYPPARKMIDNGVPVVLSTDYNPNAHCMSLPFVMHLSCVNMRMTLNEALVACTLNAAASIGKSATHGSLAVGKVGDCVIVDSKNWEHIIYELCDPPISAVIMNGSVVYSK